MSDLPMMPWWPKDYISATRHWTLAERGAYCDLLFFQWELDYLPRDTSKLARLIGTTQADFDAVWPTIGCKFSKCRKGLHNKKLTEHRQKSADLKQKRRTAGSRGGKASQAKTQANGKQTRKQKSSLHPHLHIKDLKEDASVPVEGLNLDAWGAWLSYRSSRRLPKYKTDNIAKKLAKLPYDRQMDCVQESIDQTWAGLFPGKFTGTGWRIGETYHDKLARELAEAKSAD